MEWIPSKMDITRPSTFSNFDQINPKNYQIYNLLLLSHSIPNLQLTLWPNLQSTKNVHPLLNLKYFGGGLSVQGHGFLVLDQNL